MLLTVGRDPPDPGPVTRDQGVDGVLDRPNQRQGVEPDRPSGAEGDGERNRLFAEAYNRDPDFFAFYRSMSAYEASLKSNDTRFLLRPDSEFFRFFANPTGKPAAGASAPK